MCAAVVTAATRNSLSALTRSAFGRLTIDVTVDDPKAYLRPFTRVVYRSI
jgi:hypothetical protein